MDELEAIATLIKGTRFSFANERDLCDGLEEILLGAGLTVWREVAVPGSGGRIDLVVDDGKDQPLGVEVKVDGSAGHVRRQLARYSLHYRRLLLVTTCPQHQVLAGDWPVVVVEAAAW